MTTDSLGPRNTVDRFVKAVGRLYRYIPAAQRPFRGALHHIQYERPVFDIQITDEFFAVDADPDEVVATVRATQIVERHCLTVFRRSAQAISSS